MGATAAGQGSLARKLRTSVSGAAQARGAACAVASWGRWELLGFRGVRARPNGRFYTEMRAGGFRLTLGTYNTPELAARAYDAAAW